jgi:hypothetical protein
MAHELHNIKLQGGELFDVPGDEGEVGEAVDPPDQGIEIDFKAELVLEYHEVDRTDPIETGQVWVGVMISSFFGMVSLYSYSFIIFSLVSCFI